MNWNDDLKQIERRHRMAEQMGGSAFEHGDGKPTVRERGDAVHLCTDAGSFHDIRTLAGRDRIPDLWRRFGRTRPRQEPLRRGVRPP